MNKHQMKRNKLNNPLYLIIDRELLISSLPGKVFGMLVESRGLPSYSTSIIEAKPG